MNLSRFINLWTHADDTPDPVSPAELEMAQRRLQTRLPSDYTEAVLQFGLPRPTLELLDAICERDLDLYDLSEFFTPADMIRRTEDWRDLGLPVELVAFGSDGMGNLFCFPVEGSASQTLPVFLWNHDSKDAEMIASSFGDWIDTYCRISPN
jgi:hypothetical protein